MRISILLWGVSFPIAIGAFQLALPGASCPTRTVLGATKRPSFERQETNPTSSGFLSTPDKGIALERATEIGSILLSEVFLPLVASVARPGFDGKNVDDFWNIQNREGLTNAQRVCKALEALGPTYVKFGQALASRADLIPPFLANALLKLHDDMEVFPTEVAKEIIRLDLSQSETLTSEKIFTFIESLSPEPIAAASIGQVYKGYIEGYGDVAVKVKRKNARDLVERDAALLKTVATWVESLPGWKSDRLVAARLADSVDEFMARIFEELDYKREVKSMTTFGDLYSTKRGTCRNVKVVVPDPVLEYCTENVVVMDFITGTKLDIVNTQDQAKRMENLKVVEMGITCTLSQLLETGKLHADPHLGNLLRVDTRDGIQLGYLDFGILATVPQSVRDGIVCAVVQLIFARNVEAVAALFGELQLLPQEVMDNPKDMAELTQSLDQVFTATLQFPENGLSTSSVPMIRFDNLLGALTTLVAKFQLALPPYFLNNARALATLEGVALRLNPSFNVLQVVYPFALNRLLQNPSLSKTVADTTLDLLRSPQTGLVELSRGRMIVEEAARLTGKPKRRIIADILSTRGGRRTIGKAIRISRDQKKAKKKKGM
eukprot:scaffold1485_cov171-Amphora_coffeaeformis.AAC.18